MLRWLTAGESHGPALVGVLEGLPADVAVTTDDVRAALARRRLGHGRGARMKFEQDEVRFIGGVRHGRTLGGPVADRGRQHRVAEVGDRHVRRPGRPADVLDAQARNAPLTRPRPGHADLVGMQKYGFDEARPILERASARETAARVALGAVAKAFLDQVRGRPAREPRRGDRAGRGAGRHGRCPDPDDLEALDADPVRCADPATAPRMVAEIDAARRDGDTLGGVVEVVAYGLPPGLGCARPLGPPARRAARRRAHGHPGDQGRRGRRRLPDGARGAAPLAHDEIVPGGPAACAGAPGRAGGTEGGMSTGELLRVRAAMKPIATVPRALRTVDVATGEAARREQPALRRLRRPGRGRRRRGDGGPRPRRRGAGEVRRRQRRPRPARNVEGLPRRACPTCCRSEGVVTADPAPVGRRSSSLVGARARASRPWAGSSRAGSASAFRDTDADVEATAGESDRRHLRRRPASRSSATSSGAAVAVALARARGRPRARRWRGDRSPSPSAALRGHTVVWLRRPGLRRGQARSVSPGPTPAPRQPPGPVAAA